jgi:hypothetical protein
VFKFVSSIFLGMPHHSEAGSSGTATSDPGILYTAFTRPVTNSALFFHAYR